MGRRFDNKSCEEILIGDYEFDENEVVMRLLIIHPIQIRMW